MRRKELVNNERTIMQILEQGGLGFRELHRKAKTHPKWSIGSMQTLSNVLKSLMQKGLVKQNPITKKYGLTKNGKLMAGRDVIAEDILACQYFDTIYLVRWAYWKKPPQIISNSAWLVDRKGEAGREVAIPTLRIRELWDPSVNPIRKIDSWLPQIIKCVKDYSETLGLGVSEESSLEEVWNALFKDVKRIIIVETLNPSLLLEKLKLMGISNLKELEEFEKLQQEKTEEGRT